MDSIIPYDCRMSMEQFIRFHILVYSFMNDIHLTPASIDALTLLGIKGNTRLTDICDELVERKVYLNKHSAVNTFSWLHKTGIIQKQGSHRTTVSLCDRIKGSNSRDSVLLIKCVYDTKES